MDGCGNIGEPRRLPAAGLSAARGTGVAVPQALELLRAATARLHVDKRGRDSTGACGADALLRELYQKARAHLTAAAPPADEARELAHYKEQVNVSLAGELPPSEVERHLALLPERYRRTSRPEEAAAYLRLICKLGEDAFGREWQRLDGASTRLTVCARDRQGLFADIAGTLAAQGIEILAAEVNTRDDGIAIDVFALRAAATGQAVEEYRIAAIERHLRDAVRGESDVSAAVERWRTHNAPRRRTGLVQARRRQPPNVVCDNEASPSATMIEVHARTSPGSPTRLRAASSASASTSCAPGLRPRRATRSTCST